MSAIRTRLTSQGRTSIPAAIREKLGLVLGSVVEWIDRDGEIVVRRAGRYTSADIHAALFPDGPPPKKSLKELKEGVQEYIRERHARGRY